MSVKILRLLIIDDDVQILETLSLLLGKTYMIDSAQSGTDGLELYRKNNPDIILCDLMMPQVSGMDVYNAIKAFRPGDETKIIFISGGAYSDKAAEFLASVPNFKIEKPFHTRCVHPLIEKILNGS